MVSGREDGCHLLSLEGRAKLSTVVAVIHHGRKDFSDQGAGANEARARCMPSMLGRSATVMAAIQGVMQERCSDREMGGDMARWRLLKKLPKGRKAFSRASPPSISLPRSRRPAIAGAKAAVVGASMSGYGAGGPPCFMPTSVRCEGHGNH